MSEPTSSTPPGALPAARCWYCGTPFASLGAMQAVAQNVGNHLPSAIRWVCRDGAACRDRCQAERQRQLRSSSGASAMREPIASPGEDGEILCPHCGTHILTPDGYDLQAGEAPCPVCKGRMKVTPAGAALANLRARRAERRAS